MLATFYIEPMEKKRSYRPPGRHVITPAWLMVFFHDENTTGRWDYTECSQGRVDNGSVVEEDETSSLTAGARGYRSVDTDVLLLIGCHCVYIECTS